MPTDRLKQLLILEKTKPTDAFIKFAIAKEYSRSGDLKNAWSYYTNLLKNKPEYLGTYYHAGQLKESCQEYDAALKIYATGIEIARSQNDHHALSELLGVMESLNSSR